MRGPGRAGPGGAGAAMDALCRAEPRPRRPAAASPLPWARFSAWLDCVCAGGGGGGGAGGGEGAGRGAVRGRRLKASGPGNVRGRSGAEG